MDIIKAGGVATMTSLEIAGLTGKEHKHVIRDIRSMLDELLKDGPVLDHPREDKDARGYTACFHLNRELTDTLLTGYSAAARLAVIRRWHELEVKEQVAFAIPKTMAEALRLAADQAERIEAQQAQIEAAKPAVEFVGKYVQATGLKGFREVCKLLKANEARFREFLMAEQIMYRLGGTLTAYQNHIDAGRFDVRTGVSDTEHAFTTTKFTPKGIDWVAGRWGQWCLHNDQKAA